MIQFPKAVIFDVDGTLIDSLMDIAESANFALTEMGYLTHPVDAYRYFVGEGERRLFERAIPHEARRDPKVVEGCVSLYHRRYDQLWNVHTQPYAGIKDLLDQLTERRIRLAVLSNKSDQWVQLYIHEWFSKWPFHPIFGAGKVRPLKPNPAGALEIAAALGVSPRDCIFVGDTHTDIETAKAAGMTGVGALWGFRTRQELENAGASAVISSPLELLKLF